MNQHFNIYCDESCHLEHDRHKAMVLGAVWCPESVVSAIASEVRTVKAKYGVKPTAELKWKGVSTSKLAMYEEVVTYFLDSPHLHFRGLVVPDKSVLNHSAHGHDHETFYYKMYFVMLQHIISPRDSYNIYLDIKDSRGGVKIRKLHEVFCNANWDFSRDVISRVQIIRSHETELLQLTDLLTGAVSYVNRGMAGSLAKRRIVEVLQKRTEYSLVRTTLYREDKFNLLVWRPSEQMA